jgi:hypothetical protein
MSLDARLQLEWQEATSGFVLPPVEEVLARAGTEQASRTAVTAELDELRVALAELIAKLERGDVERLATRAWTVFDVLAHLASWSRQTRVEAERLARDETFDERIPFGTTGPHAWNQVEVDRRRDRSLVELLQEVAEEHDRLTELFARLTDDEVHRVRELPRTLGDPPRSWAMPLTSMVLMTCWHGRMHLARVRALLLE